MPDLGILELTIAFFLFLPLARPYIKAFSKAGGFAYLPPIAFFCALAIFPSYGIRLECLPLLAYTLASTILNGKAENARRKGLYSSMMIVQSPLYFFASLAALILAVFIALAFLPGRDPRVLNGAESIVLKNTQGDEYFLRVYEAGSGDAASVEAGSGDAATGEAVNGVAVNGENPFLGRGGTEGGTLVLVAPPVAGSVSMVDDFCRQISNEGYEVVSFSRKDLDFSAQKASNEMFYPKPEILNKLFLTKFCGLPENKKALLAADFLERERLEDIKFVVSNLKSIKTLSNYRNLIIIGFDEAASAALLLGGNDEFIRANPELNGLIALEPGLFSLYRNKEILVKNQPLDEKGGSWFQNFFFKLFNKVKSIFPPQKKQVFDVEGDVPQLEIPALVLNKSLNPRKNNEALIKTLIANHAPTENEGNENEGNGGKEGAVNADAPDANTRNKNGGLENAGLGDGAGAPPALIFGENSIVFQTFDKNPLLYCSGLGEEYPIIAFFSGLTRNAEDAKNKVAVFSTVIAFIRSN